jgi:hypothetical protein
MAKRFLELRAKMTPEARAQAEQQAHVALQEEASKGKRADFDRFLSVVSRDKASTHDETKL